MNITANTDGGRLTVAVDGELNTLSAPEFDRIVSEKINGVTELVFDLEKVAYMSSAALRVILNAAKVMKKQGSMKIINVTDPVMDVFSFTGMVDVMDIEAI